MMAPLQSLAGVGQTATQQLGSQAGQYGTNVGNLLTGAGAAQAAGTIGGANALTSALGGGISAYQSNQRNQLLSDWLTRQNNPEANGPILLNTYNS